MDNRQKATYINILVVLLCILLAVILYFITGHIVLAIFIAPPVIYWILERNNHQSGEN